MPVASILAFWGVALMLIVVPGPDWAFTLSSGLRGQSVVLAVGGLALGYTGMTFVVAAGVGALVAETPRALAVLTLLGGGYLIWQGVRTLGAPSAPPINNSAGIGEAGATTRAQSGWSTVAQGVGVSGLNPKGLLVFLALLPQFTSPNGGWPLAIQIGALGLLFVLTCAAFYLTLGSVARTVLLSRPAVARALSRVSGACMLTIGVFLIIDRLA